MSSLLRYTLDNFKSVYIVGHKLGKTPSLGYLVGNSRGHDLHAFYFELFIIVASYICCPLLSPYDKRITSIELDKGSGAGQLDVI